MSRTIARTMMMCAGAAAAGFTMLTLSALGTSNGSISLNAINTAYTQDFSTLANAATSNAVPTGWALDETGASANNDGNYTAGTGSSNAGDVYSFGAAGNTERALGTLFSGTLTPIIGASFTNNTGSTITSLEISYVGEQWRFGTLGRADELDFQYSTTATGLNVGAYTSVIPLNFVAPIQAAVGARDGNAAANRVAVSSTISGLSIAPGATFWIRWTDFNASGADDGLAVDDFSLTPHGAVASEPALSINDVTLAEGNSGTTLFNFTVSLNSPAGAGGVTFDIATSNVTASSGSDYVAQALTSQTIPAGASTFPFTVQVNGDMTVEGNETFFVTVSNVTGATAGDVEGLGTIQNDDVSITPIHDIQGSGNASPLVGQVVTTSGIVTGRRSNGFFVQASEGDYDGDPNTSEGIFVFTSAAPPAAAALGNLVAVTGTVSEFIPNTDPNSPPTTEIIGPTVTLMSSGNLLPAPVTLTAVDTDPAGSIQQLERFEGMRVRVDSLTTIAPTGGSVSELNATSTSNGTFYGVITGVARPFREPGVEVPDPLPAGSPPGVPRFDANPERLRVSTTALAGGVALDVTTGVVVTNLVGPLDYGFRTYTIDADPAAPPTATTPNMIASPVRPATADEFTVSSFNLERFFDTVNDPSVSDVALTPTAFNNRLNKASLAIRHILQSPDIIGVEEMENLTTLQSLAARVNNDAVAAGEPDPGYQAYLVEGNDIGGIDVGLLVKNPRVTVLDVMQFGKDTMYTEPGGGLAVLNDRPPLVLRAMINSAGHPPYAVTVIVNHLRSLSGVDDPADGDRVRTKRRAQAEYLANLTQSRQTGDPTERIVSVGDYNVFQFNDGYVDSIGTIKGTPTPASQVVLASGDLVNPNLADLVDFAPASERYSFSFDGNAQELDHVLVTTGPQNALLATGLQYGRMDADFPETYRSDPNRPERVSDHDPLVAYFSLNGPLDCTSAAASPLEIVPTADHGMRSIAVTNIGGGSGDPVAIRIDAICQDESTTAEGIPAYAVDGAGVGTPTASVRAERGGVRSNPGNGRVYRIFFTASDGQPGGSCSGQVTVGVRFAATLPATDNGALFDSTKSDGAACAAVPK